ncbi:MAG: hypothetical protein WC450_06740 [Candidatus Omnitrophota bacterium]|jgi:hypothetical protein
MENEIMPDHGAEEFYRYLIPADVFEGYEKPPQDANHCVALCKKAGPGLFDISKGLARIKGDKNFFKDEICMIIPAAKVIFVFEQEREENARKRLC